MTMSRAALVALLLAVGFLTFGCGADGEVLEGGDSLVLVGGDPNADMAGVGFGGTVTMVGRCLGVDNWTVIWPKGTTVVSTSPLSIRVPGQGLIRVGDRLGGGAVNVSDKNLPDGIDAVPQGCPAEEMVEFFPHVG
jgi:hypothetical protein